jgi:F-type H+-transporting ATPase subunit epsilon
MHLTIISPEKELFNGETTLVQLPGTEGSFEILPGHAKMIATLAAGDVRIVSGHKEQKMVYINGGVMEVKDDQVLVLAT